MECIFCHLQKENWVSESEHFYAVWDIDPIQEGHLLVISKKHRMSLAELSDAEKLDLLTFQTNLITRLDRKGVFGVTIATNNGKLMDEGTHFHSHLLPRYENDSFWDNIELPIYPFEKENF